MRVDGQLFKQRAGARGRRLPLGAEGAAPDQRADDAFAALPRDRSFDIVARAQAIEEPQFLEAARNSSTCHLVWREAIDTRVAEIDLTRVRRDIAGDEVERSGFSSAVAADQAGDR